MKTNNLPPSRHFQLFSPCAISVSLGYLAIQPYNKIIGFILKDIAVFLSGWWVPWNGVTLINFGGFLKVFKICYITQAPATENNMIISIKFYTFSVSDDQSFWRYSESKSDQSYPTVSNGVTLIALGVTLIVLGVTLIGQSKLLQVWIKWT